MASSCSFVSICRTLVVVILVNYGSCQYNKPVYMSDLCRNGKTANLIIGHVVRLQPYPSKYLPNTNCTVILRWGPGVPGYMYANFLSIDIPAERACSHGSVQAYKVNPDGSMSILSGKICGTPRGFKVQSPSDIAIRFVSGSRSFTRKGFDLIANRQFTGNCSGVKCANGRCIDKVLRCDEYDNCGDGSDEKGCPLTDQSWKYILAIVFGCTTVVFVFLCCFCRNRDWGTRITQRMKRGAVSSPATYVSPPVNQTSAPPYAPAEAPPSYIQAEAPPSYASAVTNPTDQKLQFAYNTNYSGNLGAK